VSAGEPQAIGIDVGGTHLRAALLDKSGSIVQVVRHNLAGRTPEALLALLVKARAELKKTFDAIDTLPMGIGLAAQIWLESGTVAVAPNLGWHNVPFGKMLADAFGERVRMVNDLNAIAVGEAAYGAGAGCKELVCVFVGTGVGMGAVVGGEVMEGADGLATELGHIKVGPLDNGRLCGCGERGCLEAYASGRHLPDLLAEKVAQGLPSPLFDAVKGKADKLTAGAIDAAAQGNDAAAAALWVDITEHLGRAIGNVVTLFNPSMLVLGGGVFAAAPHLRRACVQRLQQCAARPASTHLQVRDTTLGDDAGIIGAALVAFHPPQSERRNRINKLSR
jgi:glucokinase